MSLQFPASYPSKEDPNPGDMVPAAPGRPSIPRKESARLALAQYMGRVFDQNAAELMQAKLAKKLSHAGASATAGMNKKFQEECECQMKERCAP